MEWACGAVISGWRPALGIRLLNWLDTVRSGLFSLNSVGRDLDDTENSILRRVRVFRLQLARPGGPVLHDSKYGYAKQLLEREKRLLLAGLHIEEEGQLRPVIEEQFFTFDSVRLEEHLGEIVPDVILTKGARELYVEIAVTHPCDAEKIQKIERRGVSTLEIDLSG